MQADDSPEPIELEDDKSKKSAGKSVAWWLKWIRASKKASKRHWDDSRAAWREYENQQDIGSESSTSTTREYPLCYPAYWSASKVIEPSYYSMTPNPMIEVDFGWEDNVAQTASVIAERLGNYFLRNGDFDTAMSAAVQDFIHADKATVQIIPEFDEEGGRNPLTPKYNNTGEVMSYHQQDGSVHTGKVMKQGDDYYEPTSACTGIRLAPVSYDEVLHTPEAKIWREVNEVAFYFCYNEDEAREKFPDLPDTAFKQGLDESERDNDKKNEPVGKYIDGWECWDRCAKTGQPVVYCVSESFPTDFLKPPAGDPYGLPGVFPCTPFIIGSKPSKSLYPTPVYIQVNPTLKQLHSCYAKVFNLIPAIRRRAIVDGASPELIDALNDLSDNEFVASEQINDIVSKGGLDKMIFYVPVAELVAAIGELNQAMDSFKANMYEWFGVPDIVRGVSDPIETLGANEMKRDQASDRFRYSKKQVAQMAQGGLEMGVDMSVKLYEPQKVAMITGYKFMTPEQQQAFPEALMVLKDPVQRLVRIDIETDSIAFIDQRLRQQQRAIVVQTITDGLKNMAAMGQIDTDFAVVGLQILLATLDGMEGGKYFIDEVKDAGQKLIEKLNQPQPAKPDYDKMKMDIETQKLALAVKVADGKQQLDQQKLELTDAISGAKNAVDTQAVEIQGVKVQNAQQQAETKAALDASREQFKQTADTLLLKLEGIKTAADVQNKAADSARANKEQEIDVLRTALSHHAEMTKQAQKAHDDAMGKMHERIGLLHDHIGTLTQQFEGLNKP